MNCFIRKPSARGNILFFIVEKMFLKPKAVLAAANENFPRGQYPPGNPEE